MKNLKAAKRYASALMQVALNQSVLDAVYRDMESLRQLISGSAEFHSMLTSPIIPEQQKKNMLSRILDPSLHPVTAEFLQLLCGKRRENILPDIIDMFHEKYQIHQGVVHVEVSSVIDLEPAQVEALTARLQVMTGRKPVLCFSKNPSLIAGFVVRVGDMVIDGSVKHQLTKLKEKFIVRKTF